MADLSDHEMILAIFKKFVPEGVPAATAAAARWWHATGLPPNTPLTVSGPSGGGPLGFISGSNGLAVDETELKRYASFGFRADMTRGVAPSDLPHMIEICDRLGTASDGAKENVIARGGKFPVDVAIYLVMTGCTQGFSPFLTPTIFAPDAIQTIHDAALYATNKWGGAGQAGTF